MKLSLDALIIIDAIARNTSFAAAADELHRSPSTITYAAKKIEDQLGIVIFDRSDYRIRLTAAGKELVRSGRHILDMVAVADSTQGLPARTYGILACQSVLTVPDKAMKHEAIRLGLGVGHLPKHMITSDLANHRLIVKKIENDSVHSSLLTYAWHNAYKGKALDWFVHRLTEINMDLDWFDVGSGS